MLAFVCEPVGGVSSGANVPHPLFFAEVRRICDEHGIRVVYDEIMSAVRSGKFLAAHFQPDALPDLVVMAKGLGAGYAPLGAMLAPAAMVDELADADRLQPGAHVHGQPDLLRRRRGRDRRGDRPRPDGQRRPDGRLPPRRPDPADGALAAVGDVRGKGLLNAIELVADRGTMACFDAGVDPADRLRVHATRHGVLLYARRQNGGRFGDWSVIAPPLIITEAEIDDLLGRLEHGARRRRRGAARLTRAPVELAGP